MSETVQALHGAGDDGLSRSAPACELTILMPCLNEAETLARCITKARAFLIRSGIVGEVLIADNGSTDGSQQIARCRGRASLPSKRRVTAVRCSAAFMPREAVT